MTSRKAAVAAIALLGACAGVLGLRRGAEPTAFPHRAHVYKGIGCLDCHAAVATAGDLDDVVLPTDESCVTCHAKPHDSRPCRGCHGSPIAVGAAIEARQHLTFAHRDHVSIVQGDCVRCHTGVRDDDATLRPSMATCLSCHAHREQFEPDRCEVCHVDLETERVLPASHLVHDDAWLRTHGAAAASSGDLCATCHSQSSCARCHGVTTAALPARLVFDETTTSSIHRAGFRSRHGEEAAAAPGTCNACHAESTCRTCHDREGVAATADTSVNPHPPGWVGIGAGDNEHGRAARRDPAACESCHGGAGEQLCVDCHRVGGIGGNPHPPGFSSRQGWTALPCRLCHQP